MSGRQSRWVDELQSFSFTVEHVPGTGNAPPDDLSCRADHVPQLKLISIRSADFVQLVRERYMGDSLALSLIKYLKEDDEPKDRRVATNIRDHA